MATLAQGGSCGRAARVPAMPRSLSPCDRVCRVWPASRVAEYCLTPGHSKLGLVPVRLYPATLDLSDLSSKNQMLLDQPLMLIVHASFALCCCTILSRTAPGHCAETWVVAEL